jgi:D-alanine-D-alanine ligase-like ATP-grasp enzyme
MRQMAKDSGINIPTFTAIFNDEILHEFTQNHPTPWVLKPRSEASASGIKKIHSTEQLWEIVNNLGEERYKFLLETFKPGDVFHVDSLVYKRKLCLLLVRNTSIHQWKFRTKVAFFAPKL